MSAFTFIKLGFCQRQHTPPHNYPTPELRIAARLPIEQLFPTDPLAVTAVPNFYPARRLLRQVLAGFPLYDNAFEIMLARKPEQPLAVLLNVVAVQ